MVSRPNETDTFCILPYNSISIDSFGTIRPCCNFNSQHEDFNEKFLNIADIRNPKDAINGIVHTRLRADVENNTRHKFCDRCWMLEDSGSDSYRTSFNEIFKSGLDWGDIASAGLSQMNRLEYWDKINCFPDQKIEYLELVLGNKCNIKCRMCNPWASSLWLDDIKKHSELEYSGEDMSRFNFEYYNTPQFKKFFNHVLPTLRRINILGGEPLIINKYYEILQEIISSKRADKVSLQFNTNLLLLQDKNFDLWKKFKHVTVNLSCDGINELNDYIRYPCKWSKWIRNLEKIISWKKELGSNLYLSIHSTLSSLSYLHMDEIYKWLQTTDIEIKMPFVIYVNQPTYMDPIHLPDEIKQEGLKRQLAVLDNLDIDSSSIRSLLTFVTNNPRDEKQWQEFIFRTKQLDTLRNQNILDYIPEFTKEFK